MGLSGGEITSALKDDVVFSAPRFSDSPNARSKTITTATGSDTFGVRETGAQCYPASMFTNMPFTFINTDTKPTPPKQPSIPNRCPR